MTNLNVFTGMLLVTSVLNSTMLIASPNNEERADVYIAKVVSDFAGKQLLAECGPKVDGLYTNINKAACVEVANSLHIKMDGLLADCKDKLLSEQACVIIHNVEEAIKELTKEQAIMAI